MSLCPKTLQSIAALLFAASACSAGSQPTSGIGSGSGSGSGSGGYPAAAGTGGSAGSAPATGGAPAIGAAGITGTGGAGGIVGGTGGLSGSGGLGGSGGAGAGAGGTGGTVGMMGGVGGSTGGVGASASVPVPSAGCMKAAGRPTGGIVSVANAHYFAFPSTYDGTKPFPVLVGFHGCGSGNRGTTSDNTEWVSYTKGSGFETDYVRAVPLSTDSGGCWNYNTDIPKVTQMYDDLLANYCIDTRRAFATGHSSGAQFVVQILTHATDAQHFTFKAVAPVSASDYGVIAAAIPVMYIQGMMDTERGGGDGRETVARFTTANSCGSTTMPYAQVDMCQSQGGGTAVTPGCKRYEGCSVPTIWCSHNDPFYGDTMHGIPCFGVKAMHDFFESLM